MVSCCDCGKVLVKEPKEHTKSDGRMTTATPDECLYTHLMLWRGRGPTAMFGSGLATLAAPRRRRRRRPLVPQSRTLHEELMEEDKVRYQVRLHRLRLWLDHIDRPQPFHLMEDSWTKSCLGLWRSGISFRSCFIAWWWTIWDYMELSPLQSSITSPALWPCAIRPLAKPLHRLWLVK